MSGGGNVSVPSGLAVADRGTFPNTAKSEGQASQEDTLNNNRDPSGAIMMEERDVGGGGGDMKFSTASSSSPPNSPTKMDSLHAHHPKDEYMEDPLPDLVGNLKITEEPEPDLTVLDQEFVLEDFEFHISTSDEEDGEMLDVDDEDDDSGSDLEFFDATCAGGGVGRTSVDGTTDLGDGSLPETENVSLDFIDHQPLSINNSDDVVPSTSSGGSSRLANVRNAAKKVAARVKIIITKGKGGSSRNGHVRVMYHNLEKPYMARVSPAHHYKNFLTLGEGAGGESEGNKEPNPNPMGRGMMSQSNSVTSELGSPIDPNMTPEELQAARAEWQGELSQVEDEIATLRQVLNAKMRRAHELKRKLGITAWSELTTDMGQGIKNVRDSTAVQKIEETFGTVTTAVTSAPLYQKTESAIKATAEKTTSLFGGLGSAVSNKIGALKNTESFRSMEERVTGAVSNIKTRMGGSRSGSVQSFDEALREATANQAGAGATNPDGTANRPNGTPTATTPSVEDKPLS